MPQNLLHLGILVGGNSFEHRVSLMSARSVLQHMNKDKYLVSIIGIHWDGTWLFIPEKEFLEDVENRREVSDYSDVATAITFSETLQPQIPQRPSLDCVFPLIHGKYGEDGCVQGLLELAHIPYIGSGVASSALCFDKVLTKKLLSAQGISTLPYICLYKHEYRSFHYQSIEKELGFPAFIKPACGGSSLGTYKVDNITSVKDALAKTFQYDHKVIIEPFVKVRELECAVLGNIHLDVSAVAEIIVHNEFHDFDSKYNHAKEHIPAQISETLTETIQMQSKQIFQMLGCQGMARVDFFLTENEQLIVNEVNTIPGFTQHSMYPKLWEHAGMNFSNLIDKLVALGLEVT